MAQPPPYDRSYNFHDYQAENPLKPLPADKLDEEFSRVKTTIDAVLQNLALIQRDDTALANKSVGYDQLKDEIQLGFNPPTDWTANHNYVARDTVFVDVSIYRCLVSHISSNDFEDDLNAGYWELVVDFASVQTAAIAARDAALQAQADAEAAQQAAEDARDDALQAQADAESARDDAVVARGGAESARDDAVVAKNAAEDAQADAEAAQLAAENARDAAVQAKNDAEGFKDDAESAASDAQDALSTAQSIYANMSGGLTGQFLVKNSNSDYDYGWADIPGGGDMFSSVYDPNGVAADAFDMDNMVEGSTNLILTAAERADIAANTSARHSHDNKAILDATEQAFTTALKNKLDWIEAGAQVNAVDSVAGLTGTITDAALSAALGLGGAATLNVGTSAGTVAAGNDPRLIDNPYGRGNILGTVSQSGGVPTGAIIERGSNANGEYVRYADGTQICTNTRFVGPISVATGHIFRTNTLPWVFPAPFVGDNIGYGGTVGGGGSWVTATSVSETQSNTRLMSSIENSSTDLTLKEFAVGRWF